MLEEPEGVAAQVHSVYRGNGVLFVRYRVGEGSEVKSRILNYCSQVWNVEPTVKPDYYKKETSRTRSRSFPHISYRSQSDESVGLGISFVCGTKSANNHIKQES